jgi:uncharacterized protein YlxW (UPF0749 family)
MSKHTVTVWVTYRPGYREGVDPTIRFVEWELKTAEDMKLWGTPVRQQSFEVEIPDNFDPRKPMLEGLNAELQKTREEFAAKVAQINEQIARLQAIEYTPPSADHSASDDRDIPF